MKVKALLINLIQVACILTPFYMWNHSGFIGHVVFGTLLLIALDSRYRWYDR